MPEPPQLAPLYVEEQWLFSKLSAGDRASLRERPAILQRKLILATCVRNQVLLVMNQKSLPQVIIGT